MSQPTPHDMPEAKLPQKDSHYDLDELVAGITPQNQHAESDFGRAVGLEKNAPRIIK